MANTPKQAKITTAEDVLKYIDAELSEYEEALAFVLVEMDGANKVQYSKVFLRKKAEYEGAIAALVGVRDFINGTETEVE